MGYVPYDFVARTIVELFILFIVLGVHDKYMHAISCNASPIM